jgi:hypothetical protein
LIEKGLLASEDALNGVEVTGSKQHEENWSATGKSKEPQKTFSAVGVRKESVSLARLASALEAAL